MESEQLYSRGYCRTGYSSYNSITSASSDEELLDSAGATMDFHTTEDDNLLDGDAASSPGSGQWRGGDGEKTHLNLVSSPPPNPYTTHPQRKATGSGWDLPPRVRSWRVRVVP
ncbi:unnamed protein product [Gadus morhua 'NCC']